MTRIAKASFLQEAHSRDLRKYQLLDLCNQADIVEEFSFAMVGVTATIYFYQRLTEAERMFLRESLGPFRQGIGEAKIKIYYRHAPKAEAKIDSGLWENPEPDYFIIDDLENTQEHRIVQRDFSAICDSEMQSIQVVGPELTVAASDTIDNLVALTFPKHLLSQRTLYLHAATIVRDEEAYVFFGASGAGKSTLADQCGNIEGYDVMSSDQVLVQKTDSGVLAHACTRKSPEFPRGHKRFRYGPLPVAGIYHLVQKGRYSYRELNFIDRLARFVGESFFYVPPIFKHDEYLDVGCQILGDPTIESAEISYPKGQSVWKLWE